MTQEYLDELRGPPPPTSVISERAKLPAGLHRVRHYGFLNGSSRRSLEEVRMLAAVANRMLHYLACSEQVETSRPPKMVCPKCGGAMICLGYTPPAIDACAASTATSSRAPP